MAPNDLTPCRMAFYFVSTFAIAQTPTKQPALRLSRTKNLHFAKAPFPGFSAEEARINLRIIDNNTLGIALDQSSSRKLIRQLWKIFALPDKQLPDLAEIDKSIGECIPDVLLRTDSILQHPVFHLYQSETDRRAMLPHEIQGLLSP